MITLRRYRKDPRTDPTAFGFGATIAFGHAEDLATVVGFGFEPDEGPMLSKYQVSTILPIWTGRALERSDFAMIVADCDGEIFHLSSFAPKLETEAKVLALEAFLDADGFRLVDDHDWTHDEVQRIALGFEPAGEETT